MADPESAVRIEMMAEFKNTQSAPFWPTARVERTIQELLNIAEELEAEIKRKKSEAATHRRAKKLAEMAADPKPTILEIEELAREQSLDSYARAARLLSDLRTAVFGTPQAHLADHQAYKIREQNPTRHHLVKALRDKGFLKK
jgi:hypothetical protein